MTVELATKLEAELAASCEASALFQPVRSEGQPVTLDVAYAVQALRVRRLRRAGHGDPVGYKVGLTSAAMQHMCGVSNPISGVLLSRRIHSSGARVAALEFGRLGVESEIALRLGMSVSDDADLEDRGALLACVESAHAAFELVDDRGASYKNLDAASIVAENSWNAGVVLGDPVSAEVLDMLEGRKGVLKVNNEVVGEGNSSDVLGSPLYVLAWLFAHLRAQGESPKPGELILTGSIVPTKFAISGDVYRFELDGLPPVEVGVT